MGSLSTLRRSECCSAPQNLALASPDLKPPTFLTYTRGTTAFPGLSDPGTNIKYMFETMRPGADPGTTTPDLRLDPGSGPPDPVPLERLEAQICELAGHLTAATCRFLVLLGDFDARRGWAQLGHAQLRRVAILEVPADLRHRPRARPSGPGAAGPAGAPRPVHGRPASYAKVRALTRIATPGTEAGLAEIAGPMTGNQLERFARAHRQVTHTDDAAARVRRRLAWRLEDDGSLAGTFRLPPLQGAVLLKALRAPPGTWTTPTTVTPAFPRKRRRGTTRRP